MINCSEVTAFYLLLKLSIFLTFSLKKRIDISMYYDTFIYNPHILTFRGTTKNLFKLCIKHDCTVYIKIALIVHISVCITPSGYNG